MNENENKDIIVSMTGTITITTEEYKQLLRRSTVLEIIESKVNKGLHSWDYESVVNSAIGILHPGEPEAPKDPGEPEDGDGDA